MDTKLQDKYKRLIASLKKLDGLALAFSGGVDSTFLLYAAQEALGDRVLALTVRSPYIPEWEIEEAGRMARELGIKHHVLEVGIPDQILHNPNDRCYLCKTYLFNMLGDFARKQGIGHIADGSNADDIFEHRPGLKALKELRVLSPLMEAGLTKSDIRTLSREKGLETWKKPAYACLLTRIPYNTRISNALLRKIEKAETYLMELGIRAVRVRVHDNLARIETEPMYIDRIFKEKMATKISRQLKQIGFSFVTLDLEGYRMGGIEELFKDKDYDGKG